MVSTRTYGLAAADPDRFLEKAVARCNLLPRKLRRGLAYAVSKNFVIWWSKQLATPLGEKGARVVSVSPGSFDTEMGRLEKSHAVRPITTRRYHPGRHRVELRVNGRAVADAAFELRLPRAVRA